MSRTQRILILAGLSILAYLIAMPVSLMFERQGQGDLFYMPEAVAQMGAPIQALVATDVTADATYTTDMFIVGVFIHSSAASAHIEIYDGPNTTPVLWRWKEATDEDSSGACIAPAYIQATTSIRIDVTNCTATLLRYDRD